MGTARDMLSNKNYLEVGPNLFDPENEQKPFCSNRQFLGQVQYLSIDWNKMSLLGSGFR